jgi:hypothetical protein
VNCTRCGRGGVVVGSACPSCGAPVVAADDLDSLLSLPAEAVEELDELDEQATGLPLLTVEPGSVGAATDLETTGGVPVTSFSDEPSLVGAPDPDWGSDPDAWSVPVDDGAPAPDPYRDPPPVIEAPLPPPPSAPLPRRTPLAETTAQWGPRDHPPAVLAPPPPHPLDAPAVARVKRPSGTGLPPGVAAGGPAPVPRVPMPPPVPSGMSTPVPERPTHPRVRRWFGRGADADMTDGPAPESTEAPVPAAAAPLEGPFAGAPEGLLDGVVAEPDLGPGVHDPAGVDAAMSRLSAGARRSALAPMAIVAALLEVDEVAEAVVEGEYQHRPAVAVLTDRRVIVANDRRWAPDVRTFGFTPHLLVHGWQDDRRATLVFALDGVGVVLEAISDRPLARDLAQRVRARCGGEPPA